MQQFQLSHWIYAVLLALLLAAQSAEAGEVRIAVAKSPLALPFYVAMENGLFDKHRVDVEVTDCVSGSECLELLDSRLVHMATSTELPVMFAGFDNKDLSVVSTFATNKSGLQFLASRSVMRNNQVRFEGLRVGYAPKTTSHYFMDLFLLFKGVDTQNVIKVPMPADELSQALLDGQVDAAVMWDPWVQDALDRGGDRIVQLQVPKLYTQTFNLIVANDVKVSEPLKVQAVMNVLDEAIQFIHSYPSRAQFIMRKYTGWSQNHVKASWHRYAFRLGLQQSLLTTLQGQARWAKREGHAFTPSGQVPEYLNYIDGSFLRERKTIPVDFVYR